MLDPAFIRYRKIKPITPMRFRCTAPPILGEAGWKEDGGIVNHDVAILQERLQLFYWSSAASVLEEARCPTLIEIGSEYGGMSLPFATVFQI